MTFDEWLKKELAYAEEKRGTQRVEDIAELMEVGVERSVFWMDFEDRIYRAEVIGGISNPEARRQYGKATAILYRMMQAIWEEFDE